MSRGRHSRILVIRRLSNDCQRCWLMDVDSRGCCTSEDALLTWLGPGVFAACATSPRGRYYFCARRRHWHKVESD